MASPTLYKQHIQAAAVLAGQLAQFQLAPIDQTVEVPKESVWSADGIRSPEHRLQVRFELSSRP